MSAGDPYQQTKRVQFGDPSGGHRNCSSLEFQAIQNAISNLDVTGLTGQSEQPPTRSPGVSVGVPAPSRPSTLSTSTSRTQVSTGSPPTNGTGEIHLPHPKSHPVHLNGQGSPTSPRDTQERLQAGEEVPRAVSAPCHPAETVWNVPAVATLPSQHAFEEGKKFGRFKLKPSGRPARTFSGSTEQQLSPMSSQLSIAGDAEGSGRSRSRFRVLNVERGASQARSGSSSSHRGSTNPSVPKSQQP